METIDAKVFTTIMVATTGFVGAIKKAFPSWTKGKEELLAIAIPILLTISFKLAGLYSQTGWDEALIWSFNMGLGATVVHDKVVNKLVKKAEPSTEESGA